MTKIDVMLDLETLGVTDSAQVIQISAVAFHLEKPPATVSDLSRTFDVILDLSMINEDNTVTLEVNTLQFWLSSEENAKVFRNLTSADTGRGEERMVHDFWEFLQTLQEEYEDVYLWGNGILFDNKKIEALFSKYNLASPIKYSNHRDVRTIVELASAKKQVTVSEYRLAHDPGLEKHNALQDALHQVMYVTEAYQDLVGGKRRL